MKASRRGAVRRAVRRAALYRKHFGVIAAAFLIMACFRVPQDDKGYYFGTLQTSPPKASLERSKGIAVAHLQISWDQYEPREGVYSSGYVDSVKRSLGRFQRSGSLVEVSLGLNHAPSWLFEKYPEAAYVNQHGDHLTETPNMVFSQTVREKAQRYINAVARDIGLEHFWAIRVVVSGTGEFTYPAGDTDRPGHTYYWAFDENAQSPKRAGRPPTVPANPFPDWKPGERAYRGNAFTEAQVRQWYDWYQRALSDAVNWQIRSYKALRYHGFLKILIPGSGYFPQDYRRAVSSRLDQSDENRLIALGVGYYRTLGQIRDRRNVQIVPTSLVDGTGEPKNNGCSPTDRRVNVLDPPRHVQETWSSMRWISRVARYYHFSLLSGESAGNHVSPYYPGVMNDAAQQMKSCGLQGLMWAFDPNLYNGTPGSSLADYSAVISRYN
ncbi:beta-galactosidase [Streptomyces sp. NPDC007907]|uniref:beta-galactosidase n=1 Tax=Streptomyces sp. NPDC007907 TaxID=3364789 RepID=UPI0036E80898